MGVVVDAKAGHVVVSRAVVPHDLCDIVITFAGSVRVKGKAIHCHPFYNFTIIRYDPSLVGSAVTSAKMSPDRPSIGCEVDFISHTSLSKTRVIKVGPESIDDSDVPCQRAMNIDYVHLNICPGAEGVLDALDRKLLALWFEHREDDSFRLRGLPTVDHAARDQSGSDGLRVQNQDSSV